MASARLDVLIRPVANIYAQYALGVASIPAVGISITAVLSASAFTRAATVLSGFALTTGTSSSGVNQAINVNATSGVN